MVKDVYKKLGIIALAAFLLSGMGTYIKHDIAQAYVRYNAAANLNTGDIKSSHILDGTIVEADMVPIFSTSTIGRLTATSTFEVTSVTATSTFAGAIRIGTSTKATAKLQIYDGSGNLGSAYGMFRVISTDSSGGNYEIRLDSPSPDIEIIETDQTAPAGKFELGVEGDKFYVAGRNAADNSFNADFVFHRQENGGEFIIGSSTPTAKFEIQDYTSSATVDWMRFVNGGAFSGGAPGLTWYNTPGVVSTARLSSAPGTSYTNSNFKIEVADSSKVLQERIRIDVSGKVGIGTTSPYQTLSVNGNAIITNNITSSYFTATSTTATSTFSGNLVVSNNASTTNMTISGTCTGCKISNYEQITATTSTSGIFGEISVTATCSGSKKILGGGAGIGTRDIELELLRTYPSSNSAWTAVVYCTNGAGCTNRILTSYATCAD